MEILGKSEVSLSDLIEERIKYAGQRQAVLAQNVANVDTPNYKAQDLKAPDFHKILQASISKLSMTRTHAAHIDSVPINTSYLLVAQETTAEMKPNGNNISLEEQMQKVSMNASDYQLAIALDKKMDTLFNIVLGLPTGKSS